MVSQACQQTIAIHILTNILRSKGNQAMKFGQLIEHNMRKYTENLVEKLSLDLFLKNQKLSISLDQKIKI